MPANERQIRVFLALKLDKNNNDRWSHFLAEWEGFMMAVINRRMFAYPSIKEDAQMEALAKVYRYIDSFDESREISPWLSRVVVSACENVKKRYGVAQRQVEVILQDAGPPGEDDGGGSFDEWIQALGWRPDMGESQLRDDLWSCVDGALSKLSGDLRRKTAFLLFYRHDYKLREIAQLLGVEQSKANNWPGAVLKAIKPEVMYNMRILGYATED